MWLALRALCCPDGRHDVMTVAVVVGNGRLPDYKNYKAIMLRVHTVIGCGSYLLFCSRIDNHDGPSCCGCTRQASAAPT